MLKLRSIKPGSPSHEEVFMRLYDPLLERALQLAGYNRALAEDLVHDVFIQFSLSCDLQSIRHIEGYLYTMLKNLYLARIRQAAQFQSVDLSVLDYDSAEISLQAAEDARVRAQVQEELRQVCSYACLRSRTSKAGSALILRFFHGYYPGEIARLMRTTRPAVEKRLELARREAKLYLEEPGQLKFLVGTELPPIQTVRQGQVGSDFLLELRDQIFQSAPGSCVSNRKWHAIYGAEKAEAVDTSLLAHLVRCPRCLDEVNRHLGLAPLSERYPMDTLGPDRRFKPGGPEGPTGGGVSGPVIHRHCRERKKITEHKPKELRIAVNGFVLGSQRLHAETNEQTLTIKGEEKIGFVEVSSEQRIRLLFLNVEPLPDGAAEQQALVHLSDGRTLGVTLDFSGPWPMLHVVYRDPTFEMVSEEDAEQKLEIRGIPGDNAKVAKGAKDASVVTIAPLVPRASLALPNFGFRISDFFRSILITHHFLLRPSTITAVLSVLLIVALLIYRLPTTTVSAAELLHRSRAAEEALLGRTDQVLHRTISLEERLVDCGLSGPADCGLSSTVPAAAAKLIARQRIEIWQSAQKGVKALRLYDAKGYLIAGQWMKPDGSQTVYRKETQDPRPKTQDQQNRGQGSGIRGQGSGDDSLFSIRNPRVPTIRNREVWHLDLSAKAFTTLVGRIEAATVEERATTYVIRYQQPTQDPRPKIQGLLKAVLVLSKADLHPIEQMFLVRVEENNPQSAIRNPQLKEYRFTELTFERHPASQVAPRMFEPDPELIGMGERENGRMGEADSLSPPRPLPHSPTRSFIATPELEVETLHLLNQARAFLGEQVSVARTSEGTLWVQAIVETEQRKAEILQALRPVLKNPAVNVDVTTVAEALARQGQPSSGPVIISQVEVKKDTLPVYAELRRHVSEKLARDAGLTDKRLLEHRIDEEVRRFADRMLNRSLEAVLHVGALKQIVEQFSPKDLQTLNPEARAKWVSMIREHAQAAQRETEMMRRELQPVFFPTPPSEKEKDETETVSDAELAGAIGRLFESVSTHDEAIRKAFSLSTENPRTMVVKTEPFWRSLKAAEKLAAAIAASSK